MKLFSKFYLHKMFHKMTHKMSHEMTPTTLYIKPLLHTTKSLKGDTVHNLCIYISV